MFFRPSFYYNEDWFVLAGAATYVHTDGQLKHHITVVSAAILPKAYLCIA